MVLCSVACLGAARAAAARQPEEAELRITLEPSIGKKIADTLPISELQQHELYHGPFPGEAGMSVAELAGLEGVAGARVHRLTVRTSRESHEMTGAEAIEGAAFPDGSRALPAFTGEAAVEFFWPPREPGELIGKHSLKGANGGPVFAAFEIEGGLLDVSAPSYSPAAPEAGKPVSFAAPRAEYHAALTELEYAWTFDDGHQSAAPAPTHVFEPPHGKGTHTYQVEVVVTGRAPEGLVSGAARAPVQVTLSEPAPPSEKKPGKPKSRLSEGTSTGPTNAPSSGVLSSQQSQSANGQPPSVSSTRSSGHGHGSGRGSSAGHGSGTAGGAKPGRRSGGAHDATASTSAGNRTGSGTGSGGPDSSKASRSSAGHRPAANASALQRPAAARRSQREPLVSGPVGVLLESGGRTPGGAALDAGSGAAAPSLPDAGRGSGRGEPSATVLGWVLGVLLVLGLVCAGGLAELRPWAHRRRFSAG